MQQNENKKAGAVAAAPPSRKELTLRALNYLTQAETRLDGNNPTQNALIGIGYAILANEEAITQLNANIWEIYDDYIKGL